MQEWKVASEGARHSRVLWALVVGAGSLLPVAACDAPSDAATIRPAPLQAEQALGEPRWQQKAGLFAPVIDAAMAYDSTRGVTVLFGGSTWAGRSGETWEWDGSVWRRAATSGPEARSIHAMAYDSVRKVTVLFGGWASGSRNDTWVWDGSSWVNKPVAGPSARANHAMAFDSARGVVVLFGGAASGTMGDTWEWNGASWQLKATTGPSARAYHVLAYDSARGVTVLFGGT